MTDSCRVSKQSASFHEASDFCPTGTLGTSSLPSLGGFGKPLCPQQSRPKKQSFWSLQNEEKMTPEDEVLDMFLEEEREEKEREGYTELTADKAQTGNRGPVSPSKQNNVATHKTKAGQREPKLVCVNHLNRPKLGDPPSWSYTPADKVKIYQWEKCMGIINALQQSSLPSKSSARELPSRAREILYPRRDGSQTFMAVLKIHNFPFISVDSGSFLLPFLSLCPR